MTSFHSYTHSNHRVLQIPILTDNYVYLICDDKKAFVVDPGLPDPVNQVLEQENLELAGILNTHHHWDHVDGNVELANKWNCPIYGCALDAHRIPGIQQQLQEGDSLPLASLQADILFTPGHTTGHIAYYFKEQGWLFSGDTLFSLGCGRLFEGTAQQMQESLQNICSLPKETLVFCTHEYTETNLRFNLSLLPDDPVLKERAIDIEKTLKENKPTVPMKLGLEIESNLFLRWKDPALRSILSMENEEDWQVFAKVREKRNHF